MCLYIVKRQLYLLVVYWVSTTIRTNTCYLQHGVESFKEAKWFAASQEIPRISRNSKVHYRTHKRPPLTSQLMEINTNIIHHLRLDLPSSLLLSGFPTNNLYTPLS